MESQTSTLVEAGSTASRLVPRTVPEISLAGGKYVWNLSVAALLIIVITFTLSSSWIDKGGELQSVTSESLQGNDTGCYLLEYHANLSAVPAGRGSHILPVWTPHVPHVRLRRGVTYEGDMIRMDGFLRKVVDQRKAVKVLALGMTAMAHYGGRKGPQNVGMAADYRIWPQHGWLSTALDYLVGVYPPSAPHQWPGQGLEPQPYWLLNEGVPATGSDFWMSCAGKVRLEELPEDIDLVVLEYALGTCVEALDTALQRLFARWQPMPAFLFINLTPWCKGDGCKDPKPNTPLDWSANGTFSEFPPGTPGEHTSSLQEETIVVMGQYYGFPVLSLRDVFFNYPANQTPQFSLHDFNAENSASWHPSRDIPSEKIADVIISFFNSAIQGLDERQAELMAPGADVVVAAFLKLPPPFFSRWYSKIYKSPDKKVKACYSAGVQLAIPFPVVANQGFYATPEMAEQEKPPALRSSAAGSRLELAINTLPERAPFNFTAPANGSAPAANSAAQAFLHIQYWQSPVELMGEADVMCGWDCSCNQLALSGSSYGNFSKAVTAKLPVSQGANCRIVITTRRGAGIGEAFDLFKLSVVFEERAQQ